MAWLLEMIRQSAEALANEDLDEACGSRRRMVARETALAKASLDLLIGALGEHIRRGIGDEASVRVASLLDRLANSACRRLVMLLAAGERPAPAVSIENALVRIEAAG